MRRIDGRLVIAGLVAVGLVFVLLNLVLGGGPTGVRVYSQPHSSPAARGVAYRVRLLSDCAPALDFDGSFWFPPGGWRLRQPAEPARAILRSPERAVLVTASGQRISLTRHDGPFRLSRCPSPSA